MKLPYEPIEPSLRSTGMKTLHKCKRMYLWEERYGLKRGIKAQPLRIGTYTHLMLRELYEGGYLAGAFEATVAYAENEKGELVRQHKLGILKSGERLEAVCNQIDEDVQKAYAMVHAYIQYYPLASNQEVLGTEIHFRVETPLVPGVIIEGEIDLLLRHKETGSLTIVDTKTHGIDSKTRAATNVFDVQTHLFYTIGLQAFLCHPYIDPAYAQCRLDCLKPPVLRGSNLEDFKWVEYNLLKKPTIKCCKTDDYDFRNYIKRVRLKYDEDTRKNPKNPPFVQTRQEVHGNPLENPEDLFRLREFAEASTHKPDDYAWFYKTANEQQCAGLFGTCSYLNLCRTDRAPAQWPAYMESTFRQEFRV